MNKPVLVIMAAGMGSRYGGLKQIDPIGPNGQIILDYSVYDAHRAGFERVVFIIRPELHEAFEQAIGAKARRFMQVDYAYQTLDRLPEGLKAPEGREKPLGTAHAVWCAKELTEGCPIAVINADDYYGRSAFLKLHAFLETYSPAQPNRFCMAGFILKNTLSDNGGVTRGICRTDEEGYLTEETRQIVKTPQGAEANGKALDLNAHVSMNMWGLTPEFLPLLEQGFQEFFRGLAGKELEAEYLLPVYIDQLLKAGRVSVKVLETEDQWFGVTYKEDKPFVQAELRKLHESGVYPASLHE